MKKILMFILLILLTGLLWSIEEGEYLYYLNNGESGEIRITSDQLIYSDNESDKYYIEGDTFYLEIEGGYFEYEIEYFTFGFYLYYTEKVRDSNIQYYEVVANPTEETLKSLFHFVSPNAIYYLK